MTADPRDVIATAPMSRLQVSVVAITIALNALDGFDVLSISFASPGIAQEWGIDRAALGIVLSMELIGMAIGSIVLGNVADRIGRRPTILGCLMVMAVGMFMATTVRGLVDLSVWRVITGLGIGGMLASINAVATEFSSVRRRHLSVSLMSIGYPVGAVVGGLVAARLLQGNDWRAVFYFGSAVTATLIPIVFFVVPESVHWLARKQPAGALDRINLALRRMGRAPATSLPAIAVNADTRSVAHIFAPGLVATTTIVTLAYFFHITTFYFIAKWIPKIVVDLGFAPSSAAGVLVWMNVGGATGGAVFGLLTLTRRCGVKPLTIALLLLSTVTVTLFGRSPADLQRLSMICALAGFCTNAGIVGLYAIIAQAFPTHVRAFGTGFTIGVGRGGSVLAPIIAGFLFAAGYSLPTVSLTMALGSLMAAGVLLWLKLEYDHRGERHVNPAPGRAQ
ncbi:MAG TPA: MFS transporter [Vicinamibacterales bacterium]|nr:MFS transporter [Vicinamibacterales bacterium]